MATDSRVSRAKALLDAGLPSQAEALYAQVLAENPDQADALFGSGCIAYRAGDVRRAVDCWERVARLEPGRADVAARLQEVRAQLPSQPRTRDSLTSRYAGLFGSQAPSAPASGPVPEPPPPEQPKPKPKRSGLMSPEEAGDANRSLIPTRYVDPDADEAKPQPAPLPDKSAPEPAAPAESGDPFDTEGTVELESRWHRKPPPHKEEPAKPPAKPASKTSGLIATGPRSPSTESPPDKASLVPPPGDEPFSFNLDDIPPIPKPKKPADSAAKGKEKTKPKPKPKAKPADADWEGEPKPKAGIFSILFVVALVGAIGYFGYAFFFVTPPSEDEKNMSGEPQAALEHLLQLLGTFERGTDPDLALGRILDCFCREDLQWFEEHYESAGDMPAPFVGGRNDLIDQGVTDAVARERLKREVFLRELLARMPTSQRVTQIRLVNRTDSQAQFELSGTIYLPERETRDVRYEVTLVKQGRSWKGKDFLGATRSPHLGL